MSVVRLALAGACGRMGRAIVEAASKTDGCVITAALTAPNDPQAGRPMRVGDIEITVTTELDCDCDALIDFTVDGGTMVWMEVCKAKRIPMVIGATGHEDGDMDRLHSASREIPIVYAPNCSIGVQALRNALSSIAAELGDAFDVEIVESHHRRKLDAPSGTAMALASDVAAATGRNLDDHIVFGRHGQIGERPRKQIGVHALRMGDLMSQHEIHFSGPGETLTLRHTAHSRDTFASGALRAAAWVVLQPPGFYGMRDVLG